MVHDNGFESYASVRTPHFSENATWSQEGITVAGSKRWGTSLAHLNFPSGLHVDDEDNVYIADYSNNRVVVWKDGAKTGEMVIGEGAQEDRTDRLRNPKDIIYNKAADSFIIVDEGNRRIAQWARSNDKGIKTIIPDVIASSVAMDDEGNLYVCDGEQHEVRRYKVGETTGTVVAGGNGKGTRLKQLSHPTFIFVDKQQAVYVSDWGNHRVVKWEKDAKKGIFIAGTHKYYTVDPDSLADPFGLVVDDAGNVYVADWGKHRVVRWTPGAPQGTILIGDKSSGNGSNQLNHPFAIAFDRRGNLIVSDYSNQRVQKFMLNNNEIMPNPDGVTPAEEELTPATKETTE